MGKAAVFIPLVELKHLPTHAEDKAYWAKLWAKYGCDDPKCNYSVSFFDGRVTVSSRSKDKQVVNKVSKSDQK